MNFCRTIPPLKFVSGAPGGYPHSAPPSSLFWQYLMFEFLHMKKDVFHTLLVNFENLKLFVIFVCYLHICFFNVTSFRDMQLQAIYSSLLAV